MTQDDAYDSVIDDQIEELEDVTAQDPVETAVSIATGDEGAGTLPLAGGAIVLLAAVRSLAHRQRRAIPLAIGGAWLVRYGLRNRRSSDRDHSTFEPETAATDETATTEDADTDEESEASRIEFADDETSTDPRRDDDDEIDLSESAMADEAGEATGPDPEQAQPTQTDATEPERTPDEDASDKKVEPGSDADDFADGESGDSSSDGEIGDE